MSVNATQSASTLAEMVGFTFEEAKAVGEIGCDLAAVGRLDEARRVFEGMIEMNAQDAAARAALGTVYQKLGRLKDAMAMYTTALGVDPTQPIALANRGELRMRQGDQGGMEDLRSAVRNDPTGITTGGRRARALLSAMAQAAQAVTQPSSSQSS
ncbi:MAG TPA: tetratricopeptide repeat protein [Myxococcaceae bacterium]|nr:tetratricopeptide repeat protein [Myxococcaceae bacterium]